MRINFWFVLQNQMPWGKPLIGCQAIIFSEMLEIKPPNSLRFNRGWLNLTVDLRQWLPCKFIGAFSRESFKY